MKKNDIVIKDGNKKDEKRMAPYEAFLEQAMKAGKIEGYALSIEFDNQILSTMHTSDEHLLHACMHGNAMLLDD